MTSKYYLYARLICIFKKILKYCDKRNFIFDIIIIIYYKLLTYYLPYEIILFNILNIQHTSAIFDSICWWSFSFCQFRFKFIVSKARPNHFFIIYMYVHCTTIHYRIKWKCLSLQYISIICLSFVLITGDIGLIYHQRFTFINLMLVYKNWVLLQ